MRENWGWILLAIVVVAMGGIDAYRRETESQSAVKTVVVQMGECAAMQKAISDALTKSQQTDWLTEAEGKKK